MSLTLVEDKTNKNLSLVEDKTQQQPQVPQETQDSFFKSIEDILTKRGAEYEQIKARELAPSPTGGGPQDVYGYALQTLGKTGIGTLSDIVGEATGRMLGAIIPEPVKAGVKSAFETEAGQSLLSGIGWTVDQYRQFAQENPSAAANIEAVANLALTAPGGAAKANFQGQLKQLLSKAAAPLEASATRENISRAREIIRPVRGLSTKVTEERLLDTKSEGALRTLTIQLDKEEERAANLLGDVYNRNKTFTENYQSGDSYIRDASQTLQSKLDSYDDVVIDSTDVYSETVKSISNLFKENPTLSKDLRRRIIANYKKILKKYTVKPEAEETPAPAPSTDLYDIWKEGNKPKKEKDTVKGEISPGDLYQVRKDFDKWWQDELATMDFKGRLSPEELIVQSVRNTLNSRIDRAVPDEKFADRLYDIHSMIRANENVKLKARTEAANAIKRTIDDVGAGSQESLLRRVGRVGAAGAATSLPSIAAGYLGGFKGALAAATATAAVGAGYGAYRAFKSPKVKRNIANFVKAMDRDATNAIWFSNRAAFVENINNLYSTLEEESPFQEQEEESK